MKTIFILALISFFGCNSKEKDSKKKVSSSNKPSQNIDYSKMVSRPSKPGYLYKIQNEVKEDPYKFEKTDFARNFYPLIQKEQENMIFSPFSLESALLLLQLTATGDAYKLLDKKLELNNSDPLKHLKLLEDTCHLVGSFNDEQNQMEFGSGIIPSKDFELNPDKMSKIKKTINVFLNAYDFNSEADIAKNELNSWIEGKTKGKIKKLIGKINSGIKLILINTLYLKAAWKDHFNEKFTFVDKFMDEKGKEHEVKMMRKTSYYPYVANEDFQGVNIPMLSDDLSFWGLLPKKDTASVINKLKDNKLKNLFGKAYDKEIFLKIPKFKIENKVTNIKEMFENTDLKPLTEVTMELSNFFTKEVPLYISKIIQGNYFVLEEGGIEAASATVMMGRGGGAPQMPPEVIFNKPFVFLLYQKSTGRLLYMGQVHKP